MNGYDFNQRVLRPWERDPAFYKSIWMARSDVPAHEGPTHHATTEVWTYSFPLDKQNQVKFLKELKVIPSLNEQAKINLIGNAKELWVAGIRDIKNQIEDLKNLLALPGISGQKAIKKALNEAIVSSENLGYWLEKEAISKTGPSGIGKENYTWYLQNVHLVPLSWADEVMILKRELARALSLIHI